MLSARLFALALAMATLPVAHAQAQATITPGMQVVDPAGKPVGIVTVVRGSDLVLKTDKHEVQLPSSSFALSEGKLLFGLSRDQLNAQTEQAIADANAKLVAGVAIYGASGALAGHIEAIDDTMVTVKLTSGKRVRLPRNAIAPSERGAVLGISAEELRRLSEEASQ